jgi:hypothetical protein
MALWRIELFDNRGDAHPSRIGYMEAATEEAAVTATVEAMGSAMLAEAKVVAHAAPALPELQVLWAQPNA